MKRAIFSVYRKEGIEKLAAFLEKKGYEIISTGGTFKYLKANGVKVTEVKDITGFPEVLDGRVKTLHPVIHSGILAMRSNEKHLEELEAHKISPVDFVVVNLYPFEGTVSRDDVTEEDIIEQIDIGGVTLIRAAAKNYNDVTVVVDNEDFERIIKEYEAVGSVPAPTRMEMACKAFAHTAYYDAIISTYFNSLMPAYFPKEYSIPLKRIQELRYGENPHQLGAVYKTYVDKNANVLDAEVLWGKKLSYNNVMDADAALDILREFWDGNPFSVIIKHTNPCGASKGDTLKEAYIRALAGDPVSAFGGIIGFNGKVDSETAEEISKQFCEIVIAPDYDFDALEILKQKKNLRIVKIASGDMGKKGHFYRKIEGGMLVQEWDRVGMDYERFDIVTGKKPSSDEERDLRFAWLICKYVKSNAIVYVKNEQVIGVGAGQLSRVDSARFGALKAKDAGFDLKGAVMASDAFFPFRDSVDTAAKDGVVAIIQPGGSKRDDESIQACNDHKISMVLTGIRHFRH
jgi:phosphoribosylaminoimidazolecarboxamide formyltransferase/IMP cyclohydrolase